jgi:hypothetical protein
MMRLAVRRLTGSANWGWAETRALAWLMVKGRPAIERVEERAVPGLAVTAMVTVPLPRPVAPDWMEDQRRGEEADQLHSAPEETATVAVPAVLERLMLLAPSE